MYVIGWPEKNIKEFYSISNKLRMAILQKDCLIKCSIRGVFSKKIFENNKKVSFYFKNKRKKENFHDTTDKFRKFILNLNMKDSHAQIQRLIVNIKHIIILEWSKEMTFKSEHAP